MCCYEELLIQDFKELEEDFTKKMNEVMEHFYPLAKQAINDGDIDKAYEILHRCPCTVGRAFIAEAILNHLGR